MKCKCEVEVYNRQRQEAVRKSASFNCSLFNLVTIHFPGKVFVWKDKNGKKTERNRLDLLMLEQHFWGLIS